MLKVAVSNQLFLTCLLLLCCQVNFSLLCFQYNVLLNAMQCIILSFSWFLSLLQSSCLGETVPDHGTFLNKVT